MRSECEIDRAINQYADMVLKICMVHLKNKADTEDIFQNVFLKYATYKGTFDDSEHEKAWLIRVTVNACKDLLKSFFHRNVISIEDIQGLLAAPLPQEKGEVLEVVMSLPEKYKDVVYLYYYEGYSAVEISRLLKKNVNTIYTRLSRAKEILKEKLGGDEIA